MKKPQGRKKARPVRLSENVMTLIVAFAKFASVTPNAAFRVMVALEIWKKRQQLLAVKEAA